MKVKSKVMHYSLFIGLLGIAPDMALAGIRIGNLSRSYADSYNQVNAIRMGTVDGTQSTAQIPTGLISNSTGVSTGIDTNGNQIQLPIRVANADLAKRIALGEVVDNVGMGTLESCARIYPEGEFSWATPTGGRGRGGAQTCVATIEMRALGAGKNGEDLVVARAYLAAGDNIKCNISDFPEAGYTSDVESVVFPADAEPTTDDVISVMNAEQKKNAGLKIAAGALIGGIGGNIAGKQERGEDSLLGTGKGKMQGTAIGALSGAALMAGNSYAGKVGGDVILSTGVNAAAGGVMGNMMASGNRVLRVEDCNVGGIKDSCLWGSVVQTKDFVIGDDNQAFYNIDTGKTIVCKKNDITNNKYENCSEQNLKNIRLEAGKNKPLHEFEKENFVSIKSDYNLQFGFDPMQKSVGKYNGGARHADGIYAKIASASTPDGLPIRAMVSGVKDKAFGLKSEDWYKIQNDKSLKLWGRDANGNSIALADGFSMENFSPMYIDSEDGGLIDISNKARLKETLTGAGIGGALGGFVGYQGAQSDIDERWVSAVREYKDSLQKVYCATGKRFLGYYNDVLMIPSMAE